MKVNKKKQRNPHIHVILSIMSF